MGIAKHKRRHRLFKHRPSPVGESHSGVRRVERTLSPRQKLGGRYELVRLIECGGSSDVYLAIDTQTAAQVIVKRLTEEAAMDPQHRERFVAGARSTMAIEHPAIGRVFSVETPEHSPPYLIMEVLHGESLASYLVREGAAPQPLALALACRVAAGLVAAHEAGIIHRDIKPGNLYLLGPIGAPCTIKVIDFGLSKDVRHSHSGPSSINLVLGTAQYMAPEQVLADPVDARTDIYALGAVLFRMLTGQLPFDLDAGAGLFCHQVFSRAPPPSWLLEDVDPRLEQVILRCLSKQPENRYPCMKALLDDLNAIASEPYRPELAASWRATWSLPDIYVPRNSGSRCVADYLARQCGAEAPPASEARRDAGLEDTLDSAVWESFSDVLRAKKSG